MADNSLLKEETSQPDGKEKPAFVANDLLVPEVELAKPSNKGKFDVNLYATKKSAANGLMDLALLMANASQLKYILSTKGEHPYYAVMMSLLIISILLQIGVGIALLFLARIRVSEENEEDASKKRNMLASRTNNIVVAGIFLLTVLNVFISAFGLNQ